MSEHCGYVVRVENLRPHSNADRLQIATFFGNDTCVGLDVVLGEIGIYFPSDLQLSTEFCDENHMCRKRADGTDDTGYLDRDKRNIRPIKLRGEKSDGIFVSLSAVVYTGVNLDELNIGDKVEMLNGHEICCKYIPKITKTTKINIQIQKSKIKSTRIDFPYFVQHIDTPQLRFNQDLFKEGDYICLTEKVHGTSTRHGNSLSISYKKNLFDKIFKRKGKEKKEYKYITGTRRTIVSDISGGYYGSNQFRVDWGGKINNKLREGEELFGEIAGFISPYNPIMSICDNRKTKDKNFIKTYGNTTTFSYGCNEKLGNNRLFVYRMTYTDSKGFVFEYPWDYVKVRAEQMGLETVPELERFIYTDQEDFMKHIEKYMDISSTLDNRHIIEGVVVRKLNAPNGFVVAKEKSFNFKVLESIIKIDAEMPDIEEMEDCLKNGV